MRSYNISEIHFEEIEPLSLSPKMKQATNLYRACKFDEAEKILTDIHANPHQIADIKAQIAFFSWEFDKAIEYILEYYPYLGEWYSGNKNSDTQKMLAFSLLHASEKIKKQAIVELQGMYDCFSKEQLDKRRYYQFKCIPQILDIANGNYQTYEKLYSPPEYTKSYEEILQGYAQYHKTELKALHCLPEDDIKIASDLLLLIMDYGKTTDFIRLYEKHCKSSKLYYRNHLRAIHIYLYLQNFERAKEAAIDYVKYGWIPIEWTDVMPVSMFDDYCFVPLFTKNLFSEIYFIPKGVDDVTKFNSDTLQFHGNFDDLFAQADKNEDAVVVDISKISIVSGKIVTADPLMHLNKETLPFSQKIPKGEYSVKALIRNKGILAVKVIFTEEYAVKYVNALIGNETQTEINELGKESFFGFSVDSGLAALMDDKVKREYLKFEEKWCKKNKSFDFYSDYLAEMFADSAKNYPEYQSDDGDYIDFQIPDTNYNSKVPVGYVCTLYGNFGKSHCTSHYITQKALERVVLDDIQRQIDFVISDSKAREKYLARKRKEADAKDSSDKKRFKEVSKRIEELDGLIQSVYEDKFSGKIPEDVCIRLMEKYQAELKALQEEYEVLKESAETEKQIEDDVDEYIRRLKSYAGAEELTRQMALDLIEYITIDRNPDKRSDPHDIHIYYKLIDKPLKNKRNALAD